jgi:hypothetical protein
MPDSSRSNSASTEAGEPPERSFAWWDMFVHPDADPRSDGPGENSERAVLMDYLKDQRLTLQLKCADLDTEQLARRSVPPSDLSLLGLVRHLAGVEQVWMQIRMSGEQVPRLYRAASGPSQTGQSHTGPSQTGPNGFGQHEFTGAVADPAVVDEAWAAWRRQVAYTDAYVAATDLGQVGAEGDHLRGVLVHLIEEYARHNGHADLLRERIDGRVGQ